MNERRILDVLLGVYAAVLLVPAGALVGWEAGTAGVPVTAFVGIGLVIAAVVTLVVRTVDDLVDRLLSLPVVVLTVGLPFVYTLPYLLFVVDPDSGAGVVAIVGMGAVLPGMLALLGGSLIRNSRLRERSTEIVAVTLDETDDEEGRQLRIAAVGIVTIALVTTGAVTVLTGEMGFSMVTSLGGLSTVFLLFANNDRELVVTDAGLVVDQSVIVWDDLAGYRLTDDKVVLVRSEWYLPDRRFDREEMDDEALIEGVGEFLPRVDEQGRVERMARN